MNKKNSQRGKSCNCRDQEAGPGHAKMSSQHPRPALEKPNLSVEAHGALFGGIEGLGFRGLGVEGFRVPSLCGFLDEQQAAASFRSTRWELTCFSPPRNE